MDDHDIRDFINELIAYTVVLDNLLSSIGEFIDDGVVRELEDIIERFDNKFTT